MAKIQINALKEYWFGKRGIALLCAVALLVLLGVRFMTGRSEPKPTELKAQDQTAADGVGSYSRFLEENASAPVGEGEYVLTFGSDGQYEKIEVGQEREAVVTVRKEGLYMMRLEYAAIGDSLYDYDISILVNGKTLYEELNNIRLKSLWEINPETLKSGNSPDLVKVKNSQTQKLFDRNGFYHEPLQIYLETGENTITLKAGELDIGVYSLILYTEKEPLKYEEYITAAEDKAAANGEPILIQAEYAPYRNNPSITEQKDSTSPETMPSNANQKIVNTIGGSSYSRAYDTLTWSFDIDAPGLYTFNMRVRQDFSSGSVVCRSLLIDGELPFEECRTLVFPYQGGFRIFTPSDTDGTPYQFYLDKGPHTVSLTVTLGENAPVIREASRVLDNLNYIYRRITMMISHDPDPYRDYLISEKLPEIMEMMEKEAAHLRNIIDYLAYMGGEWGSDSNTLEKMAWQLEQFCENPDSIPSLINSFNNNKSAVGTWIINKKSQPLEIDWLEFVPPGQQGTQNDGNIFKTLVFGAQRFLNSFVNDYSNSFDYTKQTDIWTSAGRDQLEILTRLIEERFTPEQGIKVNLKLVSTNALLPAVVSGIGPDAAIMTANGSAVNFASRKAVVDVAKLPGFDQAASEFPESALLPLRLGNGVYGMPEQMIFPVLFYRKDILDELGLTPPNTWDEAYTLMFRLQKNNMDFGVPVGLSGYCVFLYQNGGQLYTPDGSKSLIDSEEGIASFKQWIRYFDDSGRLLSYSFVNRFRSGEMPIGVSDYTTYNTLVAFAPEITDSWEMTLVPGTRREDGSIDRSVASTGTCSLLFNSSQENNAAWEFLKWWTGSETQQRYARNIEIRLGPSARYAPANKKAFDSLSWAPRQVNVLKEQLKYVKGIPEVPGGYFTTRHLTFAFNQAIVQKQDPRSVLMKNCENINLEIMEKRTELKIGGVG